MVQFSFRFSVLLMSFLALCDVTQASRLVKAVVTRTRRMLNLGSTFGSALHSDTVYDRITGHPVFAVTTSWGSPYMNMERLTDMDESVPPDPPESLLLGNSKNPKSISDDSNEMRMVVLYFMDPADAMSVHGEMKQMENLKQSDIRLTCFSLGKAIRQASNVGKGLVTGMQIESTTGALPEDSGRLRYKIVPPKRQLFYAARCVGRERVGLFSETAAEDAQRAIAGNAALDAANLLRRRAKREATFGSKLTGHHMEGYTGIPVFYCDSLQRRLPFYKRIQKPDKPFYFDYEDLMTAWNRMRVRCKDAPEEPPSVEVFNLMDVLSSMDRETAYGKDKKRQLDRITFVPSSQAVRQKEEMSRRGNGKCRLRPMR